MHSARKAPSKKASTCASTESEVGTGGDTSQRQMASVLVATHSRYVVDLNRPPDDANLYPGQDTTGLVPVDTFHREAIYLNGDENYIITESEGGYVMEIKLPYDVFAFAEAPVALSTNVIASPSS